MAIFKVERRRIVTTKTLFRQVALACLFMVTGCSAVSRNAGGLEFAAQAAGFSNATLTGTYALSGQSTGVVTQGSKKVAVVGVVTLDGKGNITSGSTTEANEQVASVCTFLMSGTY